MRIIEIKDLSLPELLPYTDTAELELKRQGVFVCESPKVIRTALESGYEPLSFLCERRYITGQAADILAAWEDVPVYTADSPVLTELTGYKLTQGIMCVMGRRPPTDLGELLRDARRIAVLEDTMNQNNLGAIFRSAAALGLDGVVLTGGCTDPLFRRCVRVSMGSVFRVKWAQGSIEELKAAGFTTAAMALREDSLELTDPGLMGIERLAIVLGTEGEGLRDETIEACDLRMKLTMHNGVDSLNVATAGAIAFWWFSTH